MSTKNTKNVCTIVVSKLIAKKERVPIQEAKQSVTKILILRKQNGEERRIFI